MARNTFRPVLAALCGLSALLESIAVPAHAQAVTSLHDIPWYMGHATVRAATLKLCRSDHRFGHDADCLNAETAEDRLYADRAKRASGDNELATPEYWLNNSLVRTGALVSCGKTPAFYPPDVCAAVRQAEALAPARKRRP